MALARRHLKCTNSVYPSASRCVDAPRAGAAVHPGITGRGQWALVDHPLAACVREVHLGRPFAALLPRGRPTSMVGRPGSSRLRWCWRGSI
jgi:hypothetical protein